MTSITDSIKTGLTALATNSTITPELWDVVIDIAGRHSGRARGQGIPLDKDDPHEQAAEFLVVLAQRSPLTLRLIHSKNELGREFRKWITHKQSPEKQELWTVLSEALLCLEKQGSVERDKKQRAYNNSNATLWYAVGNAGRRARFLNETDMRNCMPALSDKGERDRVLKPAEAQQWINNLLQKAGGELTMRDIFDAVQSELPLAKMVSLNDFGSEGDDGDEEGWYERYAAKDVAPDLQARIEDEIELSSKAVWEQAGKLERGTKKRVPGRLVLCCYWIPKIIFGKKVVLEDFGPSSTVQNVVDDLQGIIAEYVALPEGGVGAEADHIACSRVNAGIIETLQGKCSENGYCQAF